MENKQENNQRLIDNYKSLNLIFEKYHTDELKISKTFDITKIKLYEKCLDLIEKYNVFLEPKNTILLNQFSIFNNKEIRYFVHEIIEDMKLIPSFTSNIRGIGMSGKPDTQLLFCGYVDIKNKWCFVKLSEIDFKGIFIQNNNL